MQDSATAALSAQDLIARFGLQPHPEGGWYAETFRSDVPIKAQQVKQNGAEAEAEAEKTTISRCASTAIYFLVAPGSVSRLHRIQSDECWHFYMGSALTIVEIDEDSNECVVTQLGQNIAKGEVPQYVVKANRWFGSFSTSDDPSIFSFVGCTVAPGFEFEDFELASRAMLLQKHPKATDYIIKLTEGLP